MKISFKIKFIIFLILVILFVSTFKSTYAKYASSAEGTADAQVAKWQILLNENDINGAEFTNATLTPHLTNSTNVADGKVAPGATGYIDILVDFTNVDVAFLMDATVSCAMRRNNDYIDYTDFKVKGLTVYRATDANEATGNALKTYSITPVTSYSTPDTDLLFKIHSSTTSSTTFHQFNENPADPFKKSIIRVEFIWDDSNSNDSADTALGHDAAENGPINATVTVTLSFTQYTGA